MFASISSSMVAIKQHSEISSVTTLALLAIKDSKSSAIALMML
jgi:hypothetical protein